MTDLTVWMIRYYAEEPCPECGRTKPHSWPVWPSGRPAGPPDEMVTVSCPGGQRRELTGVEIDSPGLFFGGAMSVIRGHYVVIPLGD